MSIQALNIVISRRFGSGARKAVAFSLANHCDADGSTIIGQERIASESELGVRTVRAILAHFEEAGLISRHHRQRSDGARTSDATQIHFSVVRNLPAAYDSLPATDSSLPATDAEPTGSQDRGTVSANRQKNHQIGSAATDAGRNRETDIWSGRGLHDGRHGKTCLVCHPIAKDAPLP